jgi:transposase
VTKQTKLRTTQLTPNENKSFSVGTMLMVDDWYERLNLAAVIGRHKDRGFSLDVLVRGMLAYKLGDNFSVLRAGEWLNREEVREHYELEEFNVKTLYRTVEILGRYRERIVQELQDAVLKLLGRRARTFLWTGRPSYTTAIWSSSLSTATLATIVRTRSR